MDFVKQKNIKVEYTVPSYLDRWNCFLSL